MDIHISIRKSRNIAPSSAPCLTVGKTSGIFLRSRDEQERTSDAREPRVEERLWHSGMLRPYVQLAWISARPTVRWQSCILMGPCSSPPFRITDRWPPPFDPCCISFTLTRTPIGTSTWWLVHRQFAAIYARTPKDALCSL